MKAYAKMVLKTVIVSYPFAVVVLELPNMDAFAFESCNHRACTFMQIFGRGVAPPNEDCAKAGLAKAYHVIVNGRLDTACDDEFFVRPICPSYSQQQMAETCDSLEVKNTIVNPFKGTAESGLQYTYASAIAGWALFRILHDFCLLRGRSEFLSLVLGCASTFCLLVAVIFVFFWSFCVLKVFAAEVIPGVCACYYVLPELRALVAILTPCLLYVQSIRELQQRNRAILVGDHLYFQSYDVPYALVHQSPAAIDAGSFVVATAHGFFSSLHERSLSLSQVRWLCLFQRVLMATFFLPLSFSIGLAIGPAAVRICQLKNSKELPQHVVVVLMLGLCAFVGVLFLNLRKLSPCDVRGCHSETSERKHPCCNFVGRFIFMTLVVISMCWATSILSYELFLQETPITSDHALMVSQAAIAYFVLGMQVYVWLEEIRPTYQAVLIKAHKTYPPSLYIEVASSHPEYNLEAERRLAEEFLRDFPGKLSEEVNLERWRSRLNEQSNDSDLESSSDG
eukprot:Skav205864  [mRNA]  locus=scaffold766:158223:159749:+ [translate_table: standard]